MATAAPPAVGAFITIEQYAQMPTIFDVDGNELVDELIEGEIVVSPRASLRHSVLTNLIAKALRPMEERGYLVLIEGNLPIRAPRESVLGPDVIVVKKEDVYNHLDESIYGDYKPLIAVEVVSPSNKRAYLVRKSRLMIENGTAQVWIFYPKERRVEVCSAEGVSICTDQISMSPFGFDFAIDLSPIWEVK